MRRVRKKLLDKWTASLPREKALVKVFERVRDIPFKFLGKRGLESMLRAGAGTCTAKHVLLKDLLEELDYKVKYMVDKFYLNDFLRGLDTSNPEVRNLRQLAKGLKPYYHTYLKVWVDDRWVLVDGTFDLPLAKYGFTVAKNWDGKSNTPLPHVPLESYKPGDPSKFKEKMLKGEPVKDRKARELFFSKLNDFLEGLRIEGVPQ